MKKKFLVLFVGWLAAGIATGQSLGKMTLEEAIEIAYTRSPQAQMVQLTFMSRYWSFRSYKAQLLPSLNLNGNLGSYNRSLVEVRDPETGRISYVANNTLNNTLSLRINQNIALTGGSVSLYTSLDRLDQFSYNTKIYNSTPVSISYTQPLRSFNSLKWQKKTEPLQYEKAKKQYLESMENIVVQTSSYFFSVLSAQTSCRKSEENLKDTRNMYEIAQKRYNIGTLNKSELLQLELSLMNAELAVSNSKVNLEVALFSFKSYLGISERMFFELQPPMSVPEVSMEYDFVLNKALENSSHLITLEFDRLNALKSVAQAKAGRGIQVELNANLGLSKTDDDLINVYQQLKDREVIGLSVTMPIYDWGMSRGRVKIAEAEARLVQTEQEQQVVKFQQDIRIKVIQFNNQAAQCRISAKALEIAGQRYGITKERFQNVGIT
ncbi:MAG: TolC family protein, partial [Bacteroidales bacterium]